MDAEQRLRECARARNHNGCYEEHVNCTKDFGPQRCDSILRIWIGERFSDIDDTDDAGRPITSPWWRCPGCCEARPPLPTPTWQRN